MSGQNKQIARRSVEALTAGGAASVTIRSSAAFVVFLIGMRINRFWKPWKWLFR